MKKSQFVTVKKKKKIIIKGENNVKSYIINKKEGRNHSIVLFWMVFGALAKTKQRRSSKRLFVGITIVSSMKVIL